VTENEREGESKMGEGKRGEMREWRERQGGRQSEREREGKTEGDKPCYLLGGSCFATR